MRNHLRTTSSAEAVPMSKRKTVRQKRPLAGPKTKPTAKSKPEGQATAPTDSAGKKPSETGAPATVKTIRWLPSKSELASLYQRYTNGAAFDDHDKAFYFVLDVGGVSHARQLIAHVEEVLAELEEFRE
jgi:hypothetical protein